MREQFLYHYFISTSPQKTDHHHKLKWFEVKAYPKRHPKTQRPDVIIHPRVGQIIASFVLHLSLQM